MKKFNLIHLQAEDNKFLTDGTRFVKSINIGEGQSEDDWTEVTEAFVRKQRAKMTPREFLLALINKGKTREQIEAIINSDDRVWAELTGATVILRTNPLLDQLCNELDLTSDDLDEIFGLSE